MNASPGTDPDAADTGGDGAWAWTPQPDGPPASPIELWTPRGIGWASPLLGFPGATILAALNWHRMGRTGKAIVHLAAVDIGTWALILGNVGSVGPLVGVMVGYYMYLAQRSDQSALVATGRVRERNGLVAVVVALAGTLLIAGSGTLIANALWVDESAHRGEVFFFATQPASDLCMPPGQTIVFGSSDPIFATAIMREKVKPASHVVLEIDGPGGTAGPYPVGVEPPFDCLSWTLTTGPLDPGTYIVRCRYDGQPGTPDLATGTFTVKPGPGPSA